MMRSTGNFSPEWGYLAPAPSMLRTVRVVLVATAIGATAGAGVVLSLVDHTTPDSDKVAMTAHAIVTSAQAAPSESIALAAPLAHAAPVAAPAIANVKAAAVTAVVPAVTPPTVPAAAPASVPSAIQATQQATAVAPQPDNAAPSAAAATTTAAAPVQASNSPAATASDATPVDMPSTSAQPAVAALTDAPVALPAAPAVTSDAAASDDQAFVGPQQTAQQKKAKHHTASANSRDFPPIFGPTLRHLFSARAGTNYNPNHTY
jgi:hypothetical protein